LNQLEESLASIPSIYRVNMDIVNLYQGTEKMVGATENYHKGQDLCVEGAPSILMNLLLYLQFLQWCMCVCGTSDDGILATNLYINFRSIEVVALLRVLSILHNSICMPIRWLAGKTESLSNYDFGYYDMGRTLDIVETAFMKIIDDPSKFLDEDFMMGLFSEISA
jgi:hypothetical protein